MIQSLAEYERFRDAQNALVPINCRLPSLSCEHVWTAHEAQHGGFKLMSCSKCYGWTVGAVSDLIKRLQERAHQYDEYAWHGEIELEAAGELAGAVSLIRMLVAYGHEPLPADLVQMAGRFLQKYPMDDLPAHPQTG